MLLSLRAQSQLRSPLRSILSKAPLYGFHRISFSQLNQTQVFGALLSQRRSGGTLAHGLINNSLDKNARTLASTAQHLQLFNLVRNYEEMGHLIADVNPLGHTKQDLLSAPFQLSDVQALREETHGFSDTEMDSIEFETHTLETLLPLLQHLSQKSRVTLREVITACQRVFCTKIGAEYTHIVDRDAVGWIRKRLFEIQLEASSSLSEREKRRILELIARAELFESFCGRRFSGAKRFSLEGCEALIPGIESLLVRAAELGVHDVEVGMAHRGRLNFLKNVMQVPLESIVSDFEPYLPDDDEHPNNSNDVRYHLGTCAIRYFSRDPTSSLVSTLANDKKGNDLDDSEGYTVRVSLAANPSHLEAVNSVVLGKTRARQFLLRGDIHKQSTNEEVGPLGRVGSVDYSPSDHARLQVMGLLIHGDASFFQGGVRESLGFTNLRDYCTGGTVHIIVNNQIGFTTLPKESHSSTYCSDVAKSIGAPVFHVNGDDPEKVVQVCRLAVEFRQRFSRDAVVNLWCYRRHGHNEQDTPEVTQPTMYRIIREHEPLLRLYGERLKYEHDSTFSQATIDSMIDKISHEHDDGYAKVRAGEGFLNSWNEMKRLDDPETDLAFSPEVSLSNPLLDPDTGVPEGLLQKAAKAMFTLPPSSEFRVHPRVEAVMAERLRSIEAGKGFRWATAEALAWASLLVDGFHIRLSGQDVERGTFNQRHAVIYDQKGNPRTVSGAEAYHKPWTALQKLGLRSHLAIPLPTDGDDSAHIGVKEFTKNGARSIFEPSMATKVGAWGRELKRRQSGYHPTLGVMEICNSPLSEEGVLAFEHGYSLYSHHLLVMWETQFGDFANCAQAIIDTFISGGEDKWLRSSGIVLLLPHGLEGQGPDHSSAYMERWLQLCTEDEDWDGIAETTQRMRLVNMHVIIPTTPAQYFHALRRQMLLPYRKPLIILTPKYLLHHRPCSSSFKDMAPGTRFQPLLDDPDSASLKGPVKRLVLCSGKLFYRLRHTRNIARKPELSSPMDEIAFVRIEQPCPFPFDHLKNLLESEPYSKVQELIWAQEEPKNMGAWSFVQPRIRGLLSRLGKDPKILRYIGRPPFSSAGTGSFELYQSETEKLVQAILQKS